MPAAAKPPLEVALKMLARRARSEAEVRHALARKGIAASEIDPVIARLKELRYLDDAAFAARRAEALLGESGLGPDAAERRLAGSGIEEPMAREAVQAARAGASERELAEKALEKRRPRLTARSTTADKVKAARWLAGRGFSEEVARAVTGLSEDG